MLLMTAFEREKEGATMPKGKRQPTVGPALAAYFKTLRELHGWSMEVASEKMRERGVSAHRNTFYEIENDKRGIDKDTLDNLMALYGGRMADLDRLGETAERGVAVAERRYQINRLGGEERVGDMFAAIVDANESGLLAATIDDPTRLEILKILNERTDLSPAVLSLLRGLAGDRNNGT